QTRARARKITLRKQPVKNIIRLLWWATYIVGALILQQQIPGVDALVPGFLLSLQDKKRWQTFWLFLLFVLIQEGAGSIGFGGAILWYGGQIVFFRLSQRLFVADNILFVLMLSASLGAYHCALTLFICAVQKIPVDLFLLIRESIIQAIIIPAIWGVAYLSRPKALVRNT
ncbi:hypothetical protein LJC59_04950, partial [Desulfovibrio sp. OttesenSCG-928-A18]|nr:hypothetical protein [Desulfovibrio sp. OttesenSCG-928-A18]